MTPKITIPDNLKEVKGCVFKLYYGDKYVISMGRTLAWPIKSIQDDIDRYSDNMPSAKSKERLYWKFCQYVKKAKPHEYRIEVLLESESPYQLLKFCQLELDKAKDDINCLNTFFTPYISKRIQTAHKFLKERKYSDGTKNVAWINRGHYLNFRHWQLKNQETNKNT